MSNVNHLLTKDIFLSKDQWVKDKESKRCFNCSSRFDLMNRRHHCRMCGNIFDAKCTNNFLSPPTFIYENEKKIRVCDQCFEKTELFFQETEHLHLKKPLSNYWLDSTRKAELDTYLIDFLNRMFCQQAENIIDYCLQKNDLYQEWEPLVKHIIIDSVQTIKLNVLEKSCYDIQEFLKFKICHHPDQNKAKLIQGIVLTKNVAHKKNETRYPVSNHLDDQGKSRNA